MNEITSHHRTIKQTPIEEMKVIGVYICVTEFTLSFRIARVGEIYRILKYYEQGDIYYYCVKVNPNVMLTGYIGGSTLKKYFRKFG